MRVVLRGCLGRRPASGLSWLFNSVALTMVPSTFSVMTSTWSKSLEIGLSLIFDLLANGSLIWWVVLSGSFLHASLGLLTGESPGVVLVFH